MKISSVLSNDNFKTAKYALIYNEGSISNVCVRDSAYYVDPSNRWGEFISLRDVKYNIVDGVLYIDGTRIFHYKVDQILETISCKDRDLFKINQSANEKLVDPFVEERLVIHRWLRKDKIIMGIDLTDKDTIPRWYLLKYTSAYQIAISNFKLSE